MLRKLQIGLWHEVCLSAGTTSHPCGRKCRDLSSCRSSLTEREAPANDDIRLEVVEENYVNARVFFFMDVRSEEHGMETSRERVLVKGYEM